MGTDARVLGRVTAEAVTLDELESIVGGQTAYPCGDNMAKFTTRAVDDGTVENGNGTDCIR